MRPFKQQLEAQREQSNTTPQHRLMDASDAGLPSRNGRRCAAHDQPPAGEAADLAPEPLRNACPGYPGTAGPQGWSWRSLSLPSAPTLHGPDPTGAGTRNIPASVPDEESAGPLVAQFAISHA